MSGTLFPKTETSTPNIYHRARCFNIKLLTFTSFGCGENATSVSCLWLGQWKAEVACFKRRKKKYSCYYLYKVSKTWCEMMTYFTKWLRESACVGKKWRSYLSSPVSRKLYLVRHLHAQRINGIFIVWGSLNWNQPD